MSQISLHPGEQLVARVPQDREVAILFEALLGVLGVLALTAGLLVFDGAQDEAKPNTSLGTLVTLSFLLGPIAAQRLMRPIPVYWLTDRRLVLAPEKEIALSDIRRVRVWLTGLTVCTDTGRYAINLLANPSAVAALLRDTIAE